MIFTRPAIVLADLTGKPPREVYTDAIKGRVLKNVTAPASNGSAQCKVTWDDFSMIFPTFTIYLNQKKQSTALKGFLLLFVQFGQVKQPSLVLFPEIATSKQPYDPSTARLKPLMSTIAITLNPSMPTDQFFQNTTQPIQSF